MLGQIRDIAKLESEIAELKERIEKLEGWAVQHIERLEAIQMKKRIEELERQHNPIKYYTGSNWDEGTWGSGSPPFSE